jgi:hypothetical protein
MYVMLMLICFPIAIWLIVTGIEDIRKGRW